MSFVQRLRLPLAALIVALTALAACSSQDDAEPIANGLTGPSATMHPMCQQGCIETDPNPDSAGIFIGGMTADICTEGTDTDGDGLIDFCETNLAQAFAPELNYYSADEVGREPKWAAQWLDAETVRVIYLLSYYRDAGSPSHLCSLPGAPSSCFGHNGDSEHLVLDIKWHQASSHWVLSNAVYSQHYSWGVYPDGGSGYPRIQYPVHAGGYPRVWVAEGKHANYSSKSGCNGGGFLGVDTCVDVNSAVRVYVAEIYNIGSRAVHTAGQDCWVSQDPTYQYYGSGKTECYWTTQEFRGWIPYTIGGPAATDYSSILTHQGF